MDDETELERTRQSYQALRTMLAESAHPATRDRVAEELAAEWRRRRPEAQDRRLINQLARALDISPAELSTHSAEEEEAYEAFEAHVRAQMEEKPWLGDWPSEELEPEDLNPDFRRLPLYSVLGIASNTGSLAESFEEGIAHNPYVELKKPASTAQKLFLSAHGDGNGFWDCSLLPDYRITQLDQRIWLFLYKPSGAVVNWSCQARAHCHGEIRCVSDGSWWNYRYAAVKVTMDLSVLPTDALLTKQPGGASAKDLFTTSNQVSAEQTTILSYGGDCINEYRWGGWLGEVGLVRPKPWNRHKKHWVLVRVKGEVVWRGLSTAMLNFAKGYSSSGSGASYKKKPYTIDCHHPWIHEEALQVSSAPIAKVPGSFS